MQEFDVIICGAGPAGTTCALGLFDAALNVALLDKESFPREKICGDAFGGYTYKILNTISPKFGKKLLAIADGCIIKKALFVSPKGRKQLLSLDGSFTSLPRSIFDNFLLKMVKEETTTTIFENTTAQTVEIENDFVIVTTAQGKLKAKVIVGCDGVHSTVQSALTHTRQTLTDTYPGIRSYYKNVKGVKEDCIEIHFLSSVPKGYFWIFPSTNGYCNVGIGADKKVLANHKVNLRKEFHALMERSPQFKDRFAEAVLIGEEKGWSIPIGYFNSKLPISGNRVLLCGDAAALVEPATGEGIGPAMSSGRFAAQQIKKCFTKNNFSADFMKGYDKEIRKKYYRSYLIKTNTANLYDRFPFLMDWGFYLLNGWQKLKCTPKESK